jgi:hypothetical protein
MNPCENQVSPVAVSSDALLCVLERLRNAIKEAIVEARTLDANTDPLVDTILAPALREAEKMPFMRESDWETIARDEIKKRMTLDDQVAALTSRCGTLEKMVRTIGAQKPEKPDYWNSCGQCERNIDDAKDILSSHNHVIRP